MIRLARRRWPVAGAVVSCLLIAGCGGTQADPSDPYAAEIENARARVTSDFQREVLADGQITRAEYERAVDLFVECLVSHGVAAAKVVNSGGYYDYSTPGDGDVGQPMMECAQGTVTEIEYLYTERLRNPQHLPENVIVAACLVRLGAAPAGYTGDQFTSDQADSFQHAPFDPDTDAFRRCLVNPATP